MNEAVDFVNIMNKTILINKIPKNIIFLNERWNGRFRDVIDNYSFIKNCSDIQHKFVQFIDSFYCFDMVINLVLKEVQQVLEDVFKNQFLELEPCPLAQCLASGLSRHKAPTTSVFIFMRCNIIERL